MDHGVMHVKENEDNEECPIIQDNLHSRAAPKSPKWPETKRANMIATACARYTVYTGCERRGERERERLTTQDKMP